MSQPVNHIWLRSFMETQLLMALVTISHGFLSGGVYEHVMKGQNSAVGEEVR